MKHTQSPESSVKKRIFEIIQIAGGSDAPSRAFDICIMTLILLSITVTTAQTFRIPDSAARVLNIIDAACMAAFTVEYALRLWTADLLYPSGRMPYSASVSSASCPSQAPTGEKPLRLSTLQKSSRSSPSSSATKMRNTPIASLLFSPLYHIFPAL